MIFIMGCPNFYAECGKHFIIDTTEEEDDMIGVATLVDDTCYNVESELMGYKRFDYAKYHTDDRNYTGKVFAVYHSKSDDFYIEIMVRGGHYTGANIDYIFVIDNDHEYEKRQKTNDRELARAKRIIEKVCKKYTEVYNRLGVFSNGEAVYEKAT